MLRSLLHLDPQSAYQVLNLHFRSGLPAIIVVLLALLALGYAVVLYRRERNLRWGERIALMVCRVVALLLLLFLLGRPVVDVELTNTTPSNVLVLVDNSQSMAIRDTRKDTEQIAEAALALGRLRFEHPDRQREVYHATTQMLDAADAIRHAKLNQAGQIQEQIQTVLSKIHRDLDAVPGGKNAIALRDLAVIEQSQAKVKVGDQAASGAAAPGAAADAQAALAQELAAWDETHAETHASLSEEQSKQFARVLRLDLAAGLFNRPALNIPGAIDPHSAARYFRFAADLEPVSDAAHVATTAPSSGAETLPGAQIGTAIEEAVNRFNGRDIAGIVLVTSGASTGGADPLEVARTLRQRGIPLYPIGIGLPQPDDVSLRGLVVQDVVFANDMVPLRVQVLSHGFENRSATLGVSLDGAEVAQKTITLTGKPQFEEITFVATGAGTKTLEVAVSPLPGEATTDNNKVTRSLRVSDKKIKVLCIEGSPRWEFRYLRAVLKRDPRIEPTFIMTEGDRELARASKEHLARFPERPEQVFQYDMVILGDVKAATFTPAQLARMEEMVRDHGASFLLLAGSKHTPVEYLDTPIATMLPVWPETGKWEEVGDDVYPVLTAEGLTSTITTLTPVEARNRAIWANVKPLGHVPPLSGGAKPDAHVLAELSDSARRAQPLPLIAWRRYGTGKVMFVGTDRLWRMRNKTGDEFHARFWGQVVQFLSLSRLLGENQRIRIEADRTDAPVGQAIQVYADVRNESYEAIAAHTWNATVTPAGEGAQAKALPLQAVPNVPGLYSGYFTPRSAGRFQIAANPEERPYANTVDLLVHATTSEPQDAAMNRELLEQMAEASGGRYLSIRDLPLLSELLHGTDRPQTIHKEIEFWDNWLVPLLFMGFVGFEWFWRRRRDLA